MKRQREIEEDLGEDSTRIVLEILLEESFLVYPSDLLAIHKLDRFFLAKWNDSAYLEKLFRNVTKKTLELFDKTKHGAYLSNYFKVTSLCKVLGMVNMIWDQIIKPLDVSRVMRHEYHENYASGGKEVLDMAKLLGRGTRGGPITQEDRHRLLKVAHILREKHGWILGSGVRYDDIVYVRSI